MTATLITGVTGFCGPYIVREVREAFPGEFIVGWGRSEPKEVGVDLYEQVNLVDYEAVRAACGRLPRVARVIHLAGAMPPKPIEELWRSNVEGTVSLLLALSELGREGVRFLNVGSAAQYVPLSENRRLVETDACGGVNAYGRSKWTQELAAFAIGRERALEVIAARTFNLLGAGLPGTFVPGKIAGAIRRGDSTIELGKTTPERDFLDVRDAASAYVALLLHGTPGRAYNVCSGRGVSIGSLVELMLQTAGSRARIDSSAARVQRAEGDSVVGDNGLLVRTTGWSPRYELPQSVKAMLDERP